MVKLAALPFQQLAEEASGGTPITPGLHEDVDHVAGLVHDPLQIQLLPLDVEEQFVQVPDVAQPASPAPQPPSVVNPERLTTTAELLHTTR